MATFLNRNLSLSRTSGFPVERPYLIYDIGLVLVFLVSPEINGMLISKHVAFARYESSAVSVHCSPYAWLSMRLESPSSKEAEKFQLCIKAVVRPKK